MTTGDPSDLPSDRAPTPDRLLESALAFWRSALLLSAHELGLFGELASGPRDAATIERQVGLHPEFAEDFLEALVAAGLLERSEGRYRNTPEANLYLDPAKPAYIGRWLTMAGAAMREMAELTTRLRAAGGPKRACPSLADRMWADLARILETPGADDEA